MLNKGDKPNSKVKAFSCVLVAYMDHNEVKTSLDL